MALANFDQHPAETICRVTLSANAGISLLLGEHRIWVDALHYGDPPGFSGVGPEALEDILAHPDFRCPELICVTHCHRDHYAPAMLRRALECWPAANLMHPDPGFHQGTLVEAGSTEASFGDLKVRYLPLPHAADRLGRIPHYGILFSCQGLRVLVSGDCEVAAPALTNCLGNCPIHLAVMSFPWLTLPRGKVFLKQQFKPKALALYHIPFRQDDVWNYRKAVARELAKEDMEIPVYALMEPFQSVQL